jgi:hypothetical protein
LPTNRFESFAQASLYELQSALRERNGAVLLSLGFCRIPHIEVAGGTRRKMKAGGLLSPLSDPKSISTIP